MKINIIFIALLQCILLNCIGTLKNTEQAPEELRVSEGFQNPLGFYDVTPSFSWKLSQNIKKQTAYTIVVASKPELLPNQPDIWNSGKVTSNQSAFVKYEGTPFKSRENVFWQVQYWDENDNPSNWSETAQIEMGLLSNTDWKAQWIKIPDPEEWETTQYGTRLFRPQYLRNDFKLDIEVKKARLYITSKGVFQAQINGQKIGNDVLTPGWTPYHKRIETLTYDVTENLQNDKNSIGIILAEGWHSGRFGPRRRWDTVIAPPQVICQLEIEDCKGNVKTIISDKNWKATRNGPIRTSGLYDGEVYDANYEMPNWSQPQFDDSAWEPVVTENIDPKTQLFPKKHPVIKNKLKLQPVKITKQNNGEVLFDFGQNMVGVVQLNLPVKKGDTIMLRHGEILDANGELFTKNLGSAKSIDYYIAKNDSIISWQPKFTFHGFRYVELSGFNSIFKPEKSWATGIVQYSDFNMKGEFETSHNKLNQLHCNIQWGLRGNFFDVPLDCPQRSERLGWTGDAQVFIPTSLYLSDTHAFWAAWLSSMREEQFANGGIPVVVPNFTGKFAQAGWSDACTIVPWELYFRTGDTSVLEENYGMMKHWCDYHSSESNNYISYMSTVGDWLQPYSQQKDDRRGDTPNTLISTAYYAQSVKLTMKAADILGLNEDKKYYEQLLDSISKAFENEYFNDEGKIKQPYKPTQTGYLLALGFDILSQETADKAIYHLLKEIEATDNHLRTGFIGTPLLAPVLDKTGNTDKLFEILFKETYPSWFYSINQGATTMWERWDGYTHDNGFADRALSFNHYAYGAIGQWMYERIAGIAPLEAGYKKILFAPMPHLKLKETSGSYKSQYGKIKSSWKFIGSDFVYNISVPPNSLAKVILPLFIKQPNLMVNGNEVKFRIHKNSLILDNLESGDYELVYYNAR
ncbi:alpha-L-rhamnosidase [Cognatitamlana onchidii]|uniref:alpha-L-rhamnosidase n=1 Tax=Cognatitamlana onchidii TaxID=2562860 RepID=UPI0010A69A8F|nr:alpha-L-rhamnosidase [Algibacter onchidii]